jgi:hypothetical protein
MHYAFAMKICHTRGQLCCPKANNALWEVALVIYVVYDVLISTLPTHERWKSRLTSKVTTNHQVKNEEAIIIVLESIAEVDQERVVDLHRKGEEVKGI